ncbi:MAG: hypothetical protein ACJAZ2_000107 [Glaciecola sp.]|jgi:hypothetical protein
MSSSTTTSRIKILENGIIVNKLITPSAFKEPYILEQGLQLDYLCNGEEKPLLLDISRIYGSTENIKQMISHNRFYTAKSIAVLIRSKFQKQLLVIWCKIFKPQVPVQFFVKKHRAINWLKTYC